jgi:uncharacterized membrane protein
MSSPPRAFARHDPRQAAARLLIALAFGLTTALAIPERFGLPLRAVAGWDAAALAMGALAWWLILHASDSETRRRAAADDPGRRAVWILVTLASGFSLFATTVVLRDARTRAPDARDTFVVLCVVAVVSAWVLTHTAYALRYAHLYYRDDDGGEGGLVFPGEGAPAYIDFAYFSFTLGMCFQVSDVTISSRLIRRAALGQGLLSFAYNTAILATALNLVLGVFG